MKTIPLHETFSVSVVREKWSHTPMGIALFLGRMKRVHLLSYGSGGAHCSEKQCFFFWCLYPSSFIFISCHFSLVLNKRKYHVQLKFSVLLQLTYSILSQVILSGYFISTITLTWAFSSFSPFHFSNLFIALFRLLQTTLTSSLKCLTGFSSFN